MWWCVGVGAVWRAGVLATTTRQGTTVAMPPAHQHATTTAWLWWLPASHLSAPPSQRGDEKNGGSLRDHESERKDEPARSRC